MTDPSRIRRIWSNLVVCGHIQSVGWVHSTCERGIIYRVATRVLMYWNVLECTDVTNVLENVLEKSLFSYWKISVLEKSEK